MAVRLVVALRTSLAVLALAGVSVWTLGCNQAAGTGSKPAANTPSAPKADNKPQAKAPESGSTGGAGGGTETP
jgi:hypothetical protein